MQLMRLLILVLKCAILLVQSLQLVAIVAGLITSVVGAVIAGIMAVFIIKSIILLLVYSNTVKGCWLGVMGVIPGINSGSN